MANPHHRPSAAPASGVPHVMVNGKSVNDAVGDLRHSARLLALAMIGLTNCQDEVQGRQRGTYHMDDDWTHDVESLALEVAYDLENIVDAIDAGGRS